MTEKKEEIYYPSEELVKNSNISKFMEKHGIKTLDELLERAQDIEWYWAEVAKELDWFKPWDKVLEWEVPFAKWFIGGKVNICYNAIDRYLKGKNSNKDAYIYK
jgi:acetyl-CoA synthetase